MRAAVRSAKGASLSCFLTAASRLPRTFCGDRCGEDDASSKISFETRDVSGNISNSVLIGVAPDSVENEEERGDPSDDSVPRWKRTEDTRSKADQVFGILLQEGPGFSARFELEKMHLDVSTDLVREVVFRILRFIDDSNKPRCAKLGLKFFMWAGDQKNYKHTSSAYNLTMKLFAKCEETKAMWRLLDEMIKSGIPTTALTFNILISTCGDAGMARRLVERFIQSKTFNFRPFKHSFNAILYSLIVVDHYRLIEWVFQRMLLGGHSPDIFTYNVLMCAKYRLGKLDQFHSLLDEMAKNGFAPDLHTYNILLHVLGKGDKPLAALKLLNYMSDANCIPSVLHFTTLIDGLSRAGNLEACRYFFEEMLKRGCEPDVVCYTVMISGYAVAGELEKAQTLFDEMTSRGRLPNVFTYNSMIRGLCLGGEYEKACSMLKEVEEKGCIPTSSVYRVMVVRLRSAGKDTEAEEIVTRMQDRGLYPRLSSRFRAYRRC